MPPLRLIWPVALAAAVIGLSAAAQEATSAPEHDTAWHNQQALALASRQASDGWRYLPGGALWRRVAGPGTGAHPSVNDTVTVNYAGTFIDGETFDSSFDRHEPATFPLHGLIPAWQEAIPQMGLGDTIELAAPADLAYGPEGRGPIPGGATLLFKIELLAIPSR
ncbi:MAG: FKBP-type peptidyl-prolyl cis-trans isomerase [Croceibacterium sp.]